MPGLPGRLLNRRVGSPGSPGPAISGGALSAPTRLVGFGDSLMDGTGATGNIGFLSLLSGSTGLSPIELGNGGETMFQISARVVSTISSYSAATDVFLLEGGWNNRANDASYDIQAVADAVSAFRSLNPSVRFLVMGVPTSSDSSDFIGGANRARIDAMNSSRASVYTDRFVDVNTWLVDHYNSSIAQDVTDHSNGIVPSSLRSDLIHWNDAGHSLVRAALLAKMQAFGWAAAPATGATLDPATKTASATLSNGNLTAANLTGADATAQAFSTTSKTSGKRVVKMTMNASPKAALGMCTLPMSGDIGGTANSLAYWTDGGIWDSTWTSRGAPGSLASGGSVLLLIDQTANKYSFNLNSTGWSGAYDPAAGTGGHALPASMQGVPLFVAVEPSVAGAQVTVDLNPTGHGVTGAVGWDG